MKESTGLSMKKSSGLDIRIFRDLIKKNIIPIMIVILCFACVGYGISRHKKATVYTAKMKIIVNSPNGIDQPGTSAKAQADSIEAILKNINNKDKKLINLDKAEREEVFNSLKVKEDPDDQALSYSHVLTLSFSSDNQALAQKSIKDFSSSFLNKVLTNKLNTVTSVQTSNLNISEKTTPSSKKYAVAFAALGLLLSILYIAIRELFNTSYYSEQVLSYETELPVLGVIPNVQLAKKVEETQKGMK
jgi:capsular polysaccharide biosynthesis protein